MNVNTISIKISQDLEGTYGYGSSHPPKVELAWYRVIDK